MKVFVFLWFGESFSELFCLTFLLVPWSPLIVFVLCHVPCVFLTVNLSVSCLRLQCRLLCLLRWKWSCPILRSASSLSAGSAPSPIWPGNTTISWFRVWTTATSLAKVLPKVHSSTRSVRPVVFLLPQRVLSTPGPAAILGRSKCVLDRLEIPSVMAQDTGTFTCIADGKTKEFKLLVVSGLLWKCCRRMK